MKTLDRKLLRDLRLLWSQALTIALVVGAGIAAFVTSLSAVDSLAAARDAYYASARFGDVFATLKRAPESLQDALRELPGVADLETGIETVARVTLPGVPDPIVGQFVGLDLEQPPRLNVVSLAEGAALQPFDAADGARAIPVLVSRGFAQARGLGPGDELQAQINGRVRRLRVSGLALSPEFVFAGLWGLVIPPFVSQVPDLVDNVQQGAGQIAEFAKPLGITAKDVDGAVQKAREQVSGGQAAGQVLNTALLVTQWLAAIVLIVVLTFFFLKDGRHLRDWTVCLFARERRETLTEVLDRAWSALAAYVQGVFLVATIDAVRSA